MDSNLHRQIKDSLSSLLPVLTPANRERLQKLLGLLDSDRIGLDRVLQELYPSAESESRALGDLRQFLTRLREAARESGKALRIDSGNKKAPISERDLWFQFSRLCNERIEDFSRAGADLDTETLIEQKAQVVKARVRYLIDCVDSDQDQAKRLITDLRQEFAIAKEFSFEGWCPLDLQPGPRYPIRLG